MYKYDNEGKVVYSYVYDSETYTNLNGTRVVYDDQSRVFSIFHSFDYKTSSGVADDTTHYNYNYNAETGNLAKLKADGAYFSGEMIPTYDKFGRTENKIIDFSVNGSKAFYNKLIYDYVTNADSESVLVSQLISQVGKTSGSTTSTTYNYTYDNNGNITQITNASGVIQNKYYYDALGQLTREDNRAFNSTYTYSYDNAGNITSKKRYAFTTGTLGSVLNTLSYTYGDSTWKDLLTNYNGTSISYDTIGNPTTIGYAELTWQGRELTSYNDSESYELSFGYNADGIRTYKKVCDNLIGETFIHEYILNGTQIICEAVYYVGDDLELEERYRIVYLYDETGAPVGMKYREPSYAEGVYDVFFFEKNLQGDIIAVYNSSGTKLITYDYDAWGNCTESYASQFLPGGAIHNPFRYRGYYYDVETGWYYVGSRYYDPEIGRWISSDNIDYLGADGSLLSYNLFAYCMNDPVNRFDDNGNWSLPNWAKVAIGAVATVAAVAVTVATGGAAAPVLLGVAVSTITSGAIGYATGGVEGMKDGLANGFMMGGLSALGGSVVSAGVKAVKTARQGITIGRGMDKVNRAAGLTDTATYSSDALWKPLNGSYYNGIKKIFGEKAANAVSCACNKLYIKTMRTLGAVIYDSGLNGYAQAGQFYGMELEVLEGYANLVQMY